MKRYLFFASLFVAATATHAQTTADAVRYAQDNTNGTARFRAMSGAFGALGGDMSAININPAGSAVFNYNTITGSLTSYNISNESNYFGTKTKKNDNSFELNQLGGVWVFNSMNPEAKWKKLAVGINYENKNNFDNSIFNRGTNPYHNLSNYFRPYAQGITLNTLENAYYEDMSFNAQQAYLGYNAYIFDPLDPDNPNNITYITNPNIASGNPFYQEHSIATSGFNGKLTVNFASQYSKWLYLGMNLNIHFTDYITSVSFYEEYNSPSATGLQAVRFNDERYTYGAGFSLNVGAIAKVTEALRLGVAYESPTWYSLQDEVTQNIASTCIDCDGTGTRTFITDPGLTFVQDDYSLRTPAKYTGSLAYVFGKVGLLSVDLAAKDYGSTSFSDRYADTNEDIEEQLGWAREVRVGAEVRIKAVSLRGGFRYEESPYKDNTMSDLKGFSTGIGFAFGNSRLDLAYNYFKREMNVNPLNSTFFPSAARVNSNNNNVSLSYTLDL
jgi:hypothetical protein